MSDIIDLALEYAPFALVCTIVLVLLFILCGNLLMKKRVPIWWILLTSAYVGLLFAGTLRIVSFRELIEWHEPEFWDIGSQFSFSAHDVYNVALFLPWGILGTIRAKKISSLFICLASGVMASVFIETFQLYHMRSFDLGDIMTNTVGCILGILVTMPFIVKRMVYLRRKHRHAR
ncbi:MAG: VanZ family protein [Clostridia bacterium]|nr:VanZ family protein [Clostridia bacterium]